MSSDYSQRIFSHFRVISNDWHVFAHSLCVCMVPESIQLVWTLAGPIGELGRVFFFGGSVLTFLGLFVGVFAFSTTLACWCTHLIHPRGY